MSQERIYSSLNQNIQSFYQQPLYPKFFQELPIKKDKDSSFQKRRPLIFDKDFCQREKSVLDFGPFEGSMNTGLLKEALTKEIKENIDCVKEDLLESFRRVLDNFREESQDLNQEIESIQKKNLDSDEILDNFDIKIHDMRGKLQDITNKMPQKIEKNPEILDSKKIPEEIVNKMEKDFIFMQKNIKKSLFEQKENIHNYLTFEVPNKHSEKINDSKQIIEKTSKIMKDMNKGWDQKTLMIKEQLDRKFKVSEKNAKNELEIMEKSLNFENETQVFDELDQKMHNKFKDLRLLVDEMNENLNKKLNCNEIERFCSEMRLDEMFNPFLRDFKDLGFKIQEQKRKFHDFKQDLMDLLEESKQKLKEVLKKKGEILEKKEVNIEKTYSKLQEYQSQIDKFEPLLEGLSGFCQKLLDFELKLGFNEKKIPELKDEIKAKAENMENFLIILDEMKETQDHFSNKLDLIWQKFSNLQEKVQTSSDEFFKEIETFHKPPEILSNKLKTPIKAKFNISKSPLEQQNVLKSPLQKPLDFNNIKVEEYLSPESFRKNENFNKDLKITSSPVMNLNINAFSLGKSPLGAETRALVNQNKIPGHIGDLDNLNLNGRFSSFGGKGKGISMNFERLSDMGFKNCEETGFQINEEGMVMGVDGNVILDSEGNAIRLLPEYMDFLSHN